MKYLFLLDLILHDFVGTAKGQHEVLEGMAKKMTSLFVSIGKYFSFDIKKYPLEDLFADLKTFIVQFHVRGSLGLGICKWGDAPIV